MKWFYMEGGQEHGPFGKDRMQELVREGIIVKGTHVRNDSTLNWTAYGRLVEMAARNAPAGGGQPAAGPGGGEGAAGPGTALCSECGDAFAVDRLVTYRGRKVCAKCSPALLQRIGEGAPDGRYAGFWIRFLAKLIDGLILMVPLLAINAALAYNVSEMDMMGNFTGDYTPAAVAGLALRHLLNLFIPLGYSTYFVGRYAATPGKMALGLRIILPGGGRVSYARALGRHFAEFLSKITLYVGYIMAGFDDEKRALHDHIAGTRVIRGASGEHGAAAL
jgi:uncharacterized RDD family membrane protein YckC